MFKTLLNILTISLDPIYSRISLWKSKLKSKEFEYAVSNGRKRKLDFYAPSNANSPVPLIIYIHGGGWIMGSKKNLQPGILKQVNRGFAVASVSYSFAPWSKWPTQAMELKAAVRWLRANAEKLNIDSEKFIVWGLSAGGHIASIIATSNGSDKLEGSLGNLSVSSSVQGAIIWYGPSELVRLVDDLGVLKLFGKINIAFLYGAFFKKKQTEINQVANPSIYINPQTPPFYLMHGTADRIVPINQSNIFYDALKQKGIKVQYKVIPGYVHADRRLNRQEHVIELESFLDEIVRS